MNAVDPTPAEQKAQLLQRMQGQRDRWRQAREPAVEGGAGEVPETTEGTEDRFPRSQTVRFLLANPALAVAAVGAVIAVGPARLVRWGAWLLPLLVRR